MNSDQIVSQMNKHLHTASEMLAGWLAGILPRTSKNWWEDCVLEKLSYNQRTLATERGFSCLEEFDLAALLRIADKSWYEMRSVIYLHNEDRSRIKDMIGVRNTWAHCGAVIPGKDTIVSDLEILKRFFELLEADRKQIADIEQMIEEVKTPSTVNFDAIASEPDPDVERMQNDLSSAMNNPTDTAITEGAVVCLASDPSATGVVMSITDMNGIRKYSVFIDRTVRNFYDGQIRPLVEQAADHFVDIKTFRSHLTAWQINHPSGRDLYSLNAARIDFVPYQFRPALKLIRADEPRILIADSVGVGKTIEAGLIIKELQARKDLENILIICPKPLVMERKWELEMRRFDEEFVPVDGPQLRQIIANTDRDGVWPARYSRAIIPYSILDGRAYAGENRKGQSVCSLSRLDPAPHFDLVIVDEAHHIRNGSMQKEKAYDYKCVKYFCDHSDAVVMLTATPLQMGNQDLYTLLNVLRPDVVTDLETFHMMSRPNEYVTRCAAHIRRQNDEWTAKALEELRGLLQTEWGEKVTAHKPGYTASVRMLSQKEITREDRVRLLTEVEGLHSFDSMLSRTRRKDIQDFCIRRPVTLSVEFTETQKTLHDELLRFESIALSRLHANAKSISFMTTTLRRQAASCIFGVAPHIRALTQRRFEELLADPDSGYSDASLIGKDFDKDALRHISQRLLDLADHLPSEDPKFDEMMKVIRKKQDQDNNKIIIFSTFRYTLAYLHGKLEEEGLRAGQIDGSVGDEERRELRARFEYPRDNVDALDILLFTEVGSEGLDYQFCNMMINYDLPWNPMKIEQRIGRIDRRGQASETVSIINIITEGTVDADIFYRCLERIGIFESSIGDCDAILGDIATQIEKIAGNPELTEEERQRKLEQMADNEIRKLQEMTRLEEGEKDLFGIDLSEYTTAQEIRLAENPWMTPDNLRNLIEQYLSSRLEGDRKRTYIYGEGRQSSLRLSASARREIRKDYQKLPEGREAARRSWDNWLKGTEPSHRITFDAEIAQADDNTFFITAMHPLAKQAAAYFGAKIGSDELCIHLNAFADTLAVGTYHFSIYAWTYTGFNPHSRTVVVCNDPTAAKEIPNLLQESCNPETDGKMDHDILDVLEQQHYQQWMKAKAEAISEARAAANSRIENLKSGLQRKQLSIESQIRQMKDVERIVRMRRAELEKVIDQTNAKIQEIEDSLLKTDIHFSCMAHGVLDVMEQ